MSSDVPPKTGPASIDMNAEEHDGCLAITEVHSVLRRLAHYYASRAEAALKVAKEQNDPASVATTAITASNWLAKQDAVLKVAENLEITLKREDDIQ